MLITPERAKYLYFHTGIKMQHSREKLDNVLFLGMLYHISSLVISVVLGLSMILVFLAGNWVKKSRIKNDPSVADEGFGAIEGSLLGLLALLLSFTFGMSNSRYDARYQAMV